MEMNDNNTSTKREIIEYFDVFFGLFNSFVMSFMVLIILTNLFLAFLAHIFVLVLMIGIILTFLKKNPFYMVFVYGSILCGSFYAIPGILVIPTTNFSYGFFDYLIFGIAILEIFYIIIKFKESNLLETWGKMSLIRDRAQYDASLHYVLSDPGSLRIQKQKALEDVLIEKGKKEEYYIKYKRSWILSICVISVIGFYIVYFTSFGL
jgi:hypothetical protein